MERKLNTKEVMLVSRIFKDVNLKHYIEYLLSSKLNGILKSKGENKEKMLVIACDIFAFILQNMCEAEENIYKLIMKYKNIDLKTVENLDIDELTNILKEIFTAGIPKALGDYLNLSEAKKKIAELKDFQKKN